MAEHPPDTHFSYPDFMERILEEWGFYGGEARSGPDTGRTLAAIAHCRNTPDGVPGNGFFRPGYD